MDYNEYNPEYAQMYILPGDELPIELVENYAGNRGDDKETMIEKEIMTEEESDR